MAVGLVAGAASAVERAGVEPVDSALGAADGLVAVAWVGSHVGQTKSPSRSRRLLGAARARSERMGTMASEKPMLTRWGCQFEFDCTTVSGWSRTLDIEVYKNCPSVRMFDEGLRFNLR